MQAATTAQPTTRATATPASSRRSASVKSLSDDLFGHFQVAFNSFRGLRELAEDMRILSLNAELAAGRAGTKGVAVRALTQYTRQLVTQLHRLEDEIEAQHSGTEKLEALAAEHLGANTDEMDNDALDSRRSAIEGLMSGVMTHARNLAGQSSRIRTVSEQSNGIATNIAIEAAAAGAHESEFRTVANTMKTYITDLQTMVETSDHAIRQAEDLCRLLARRLKVAGT